MPQTLFYEPAVSGRVLWGALFGSFGAPFSGGNWSSKSSDSCPIKY